MITDWAPEPEESQQSEEAELTPAQERAANRQPHLRSCKHITLAREEQIAIWCREDLERER